MVLPEFLMGIDVLPQPVGLQLCRECKLVVQFIVDIHEVHDRHDNCDGQRDRKPQTADEGGQVIARSLHLAPASIPAVRSSASPADLPRKATKAGPSGLTTVGTTRYMVLP